MTKFALAREDSRMKRPPQKNNRKRPGGPPPQGKTRRPPPRPRSEDDDDDDEGCCAKLAMKRIDRNLHAFQPPFCALDRKEDIDEVHQMIAAGELEIARDELLYLVGDCRAFLEAHNTLGELALEDDDVPLAQGHFGFAYEIGIDSLPPGFRGVLPANRDYNSAFFYAGRGLARCLIARGQKEKGREVLVRLLQLDPREQTVKSLLAELDEKSAAK